MLRLTFAQMRRSMGRLAAAGIAVVIGTAFVAATLLAGDLITRSVHDSIASQFAQADLVVEGTLAPDDVEHLAQAPGVEALQGVLVSPQGITSGARTVWQATTPLASDPRLNPLKLADGAWPTGDEQIALPVDVAERLQVSVGDTVGTERWVLEEAGGNEGEAAQADGDQGDSDQADLGPTSTRVTDDLTVVGLVDDPRGAYSRYGGAAVMTTDALLARVADEGTPPTFEAAAVVLSAGASLDDTRTALDRMAPDGATVVTPDEHAAAVAQRFTGGQDVIFLVFVLTFAAIALLVAGLVITNTFQVLVAQRTRTLALLRAVGANKRQVGSGVLLEATLLGVLSSLAGVLAGCGLGQLALVVAGRSEAAAFLPSSITVTWPVVVVPVLVGTAVTVLAALVPARNATRVAPLAALRPDDGPTVEKGSAGRVRLVLSSLAVVGGFALLAGGAASGSLADDAQLGLLLGVAGGAISFVGVAVGAVFWLPRVASWAGRLAGLSGPTARLAAANTLRNPRRTAATSTALLIGVTLVAMMSTGAASARTSLAASLDETFPVDVAIAGLESGEGFDTLPADLAIEVARTPGVAAVTSPVTTTVTFADRLIGADGAVAVGTPPSSDEALTVTAHGVDVDDARATFNDATLVAGLEPGVVSVPEWMSQEWQLPDGADITLTGPSGEVTLTVDVVPGGLGALLMSSQDLAELDAQATTGQLWIALHEGDLSAVGALQDLVSDSAVSAFVEGTAVERADFEMVIDTALGVVVGLLAVAVVIALIGVANTLSLSVLERRRESATLRAIGVTRGQLRWMLAVEGMLIAGVGSLLGIGLGLVYGWAGSLAALGVMGPVELAVPWRDLVLVAAIALAAGLVASVAPGRSAARSSPVAALASE